MSENELFHGFVCEKFNFEDTVGIVVKPNTKPNRRIVFKTEYSSDVELIGKVSKTGRIIIGGGELLRSSFAFLIKKYLNKEVICATDNQVENSTVFGAISILNGKI